MISHRNNFSTGVWKTTSPEKKILGDISLKSTKSGARGEFLLLFRRADARLKGVFFYRTRHEDLLPPEYFFLQTFPYWVVLFTDTSMKIYFPLNSFFTDFPYCRVFLQTPLWRFTYPEYLFLTDFPYCIVFFTDTGMKIYFPLPYKAQAGDPPPATPRAYGQFSKVQSGKMGPAPGRFELSEGILKWK